EITTLDIQRDERHQHGRRVTSDVVHLGAQDDVGERLVATDRMHLQVAADVPSVLGRGRFIGRYATCPVDELLIDSWRKPDKFAHAVTDDAGTVADLRPGS